MNAVNSLRDFLRPMMIGLLLGGSFVVSSVDRATAGTCTQLTVETVRVSSSGSFTFHSGPRAETPDGMRVVNSSPVCGRVSSVIVYKDMNNWVEVGWAEWNSLNLPLRCSNGSTSVPRQLNVAKIGGTVFCHPSSSLPPAISDGWHRFRLANPLLDGDIEAFVDGTRVKTWDSGWNKGISMANTERFSFNDSAFGNFKKMQFETGSGWSDWNHRRCWHDTDSVFETTTGPLGIPAHVVIKEVFDDSEPFCDNRAF